MHNLILKIREHKSFFLIINLLLLLPSIRFFVKFSNFYLFIFYVVGINILTFLIFKNIKKFKFLNYPLWFIFWGVLTVLNFYIYPIIDARRNLGKGSTGDDAMILASKSLMSTGKIYDLIIDFKTPISPGPAWVIFNAPFSIFDMFAIVFELFFNGHDMLPFSLAFTSLSIVINKILTKQNNILFSIVLGLLLGICCTSRIVFFYIPLTFYFILRSYNRKNAIVLLVVSFLTYLSFNFYYFMINDFYQPMHLLSKGRLLLSDYGLTFVLIIFISFNYFLIRKLMTAKVNWHIIVAIAFSLVTIPFSIGDLIYQNFSLINWEGANYLVITIPHFITYIIAKINNNYIQIS
jgi:hypothetical protein